MPSTIPYNPSLVLGSLVKQEALTSVIEIAKLQAGPDTFEAELNSLIASRRSLDMTKSELANMGVPVNDLSTSIEDLNKEIQTAAASFAKAKMEAEASMRPLRKGLKDVDAGMESPVDYVKTEIKNMPLAADSINMNVQYFSRDATTESDESYAESISAYVSGQTKFLGTTQQFQIGAAAGKQASSQLKKHDITGTLVLSVSCTHKNAAILAPFIINVDKGIKVWNHLKPEKKLDPTNPTDILSAANSGHEDDHISLISGQTFGSSFVGMVHILNTTSTRVSESLSTVVATLQRQMDAGAWFQSQSGGYGVNASFGNNVKSLLSSQNITSHVTMICMGVIPSIVSSEVKLSVATFADLSPKSSMDAIASIQNASAGDHDSVKQSADAARTGAQMESMKANQIKASLSALSEIDDGNNKILDINSMMIALEDYLKKAAEGTSGVPINYYLKDISRQMLAEMWVAKYYPGKYLAIAGDDSAPAPSGGGGPNSNTGGGGGGSSGGAGGEGGA